MAKIFTAQRNILTLDEREDLEDDEKEEFSEYESFFLYLIGQCRQEGGKRVQGNDTGKSLGRIQIQAQSYSIQYTRIRSTYSKTLPSRVGTNIDPPIFVQGVLHRYRQSFRPKVSLEIPLNLMQIT